jgi:hypothetical protein
MRYYADNFFPLSSLTNPVRYKVLVPKTIEKRSFINQFLGIQNTYLRKNVPYKSTLEFYAKDDKESKLLPLPSPLLPLALFFLKYHFSSLPNPLKTENFGSLSENGTMGTYHDEHV